MKAKMGMYEAIALRTMLYGSESWALNVEQRRKLEAAEMRCLRSMCGVSLRDRIRNEEIKRRFD